jgi:uncharacterized RDD family membrane protein YckC
MNPFQDVEPIVATLVEENPYQSPTAYSNQVTISKKRYKWLVISNNIYAVSVALHCISPIAFLLFDLVSRETQDFVDYSYFTAFFISVTAFVFSLLAGKK